MTRGEHARRVVAHGVRDEHAVRRQDAGMTRHDHRADIEPARDFAACIPPAPPNARSAKSRGSWPRSTETTRIARSMLALATLDDAFGQRRYGRADRAGHFGRHPPDSIDVEGHATAQEILGIEPAQQQVGVGHRQLAARAIADRPGHRASASRSDAQRAAAVHVGDRSAARADRVNVDHRQSHRKIADLRRPWSCRSRRRSG